ncbi:MAG: 50S ribosomal protein L10 [Candidatus Izemoplasmatales bacterium]|jgi:large subunit ribosomal protein L10|nr:50S ribosomal protein L10 [Candidatus Izemoplasmatales bacterium]
MSRETVINVKQEAVNEITTKMQKAKSIVVAEYRGLTVDKTETLRRQLRKEGCELVVTKNNISRRAANSLGYNGLDADLYGPNGIVFAYNDAVSAAKVLHEFAKKNPKLVVKSGIVDGDFYQPAEIKQIASLPSREVLLTMLASQLLAPLKDLSVGLYMIANKEE